MSVYKIHSKGPIDLTFAQGKLVCRDNEDGVYEYHTYVPGQPSPHNSETCRTCIARRREAEAETRRRAENLLSSLQSHLPEIAEVPRHEDYEEDFTSVFGPPSSSGSSDTEDDDLTDSCSGIQDILLTGEVYHSSIFPLGQYSKFLPLRLRRPTLITVSPGGALCCLAEYVLGTVLLPSFAFP